VSTLYRQLFYVTANGVFLASPAAKIKSKHGVVNRSNQPTNLIGGFLARTADSCRYQLKVLLHIKSLFPGFQNQTGGLRWPVNIFDSCSAMKKSTMSYDNAIFSDS
jgi:hypothetical protein